MKMKLKDILSTPVHRTLENRELVNQSGPAPTRKVTAAGAGALAGLPLGFAIAWSIEAITGIPVPEEVGNAIVGAVTGLFAVVSAYMTKEKRANMTGGDR